MVPENSLSESATEAAQKFLPLLRRGETERFAVELSIGPAEAEFLLSSNDTNRKLGPAKIAQFAADMRHGRWKANGASIIVARTGELNDGQHRLVAVMQTGLTVPMMVTFGVTRDSRDTIDIGKVRSVSDHLQMKGYKYASSLASTALALISFEQANGRGVGSNSIVSAMEQQDRVISDELLREIVVYVEKNRPTFLRTSHGAMAFYVLARIAPSEARRYIDGVLTGLNLGKTDPAYLVRERLMRAREAERGTGTDRAKKGLTEQGVIEVIFRGWNMFVTGKSDATKIQARGTLPLLRRPRTHTFTSELPEDSGPAPENFVPYDTEERTDARELDVA